MYIPDKKILENYAKVMIDFALGKGKGIKEKEVVYLQYDSEALPLAISVFKRARLAGQNMAHQSFVEFSSSNRTSNRPPV